MCHMTVENLDELENNHPQRYAEFWMHYQAAMLVLHEEGILTPSLAKIYGFQEPEGSAT